jgi:hypothetical protein
MSLSKGFISGGKKKQPFEEGVYVARIVQLVDLGIQHTEYEGQEKDVHQVYITYEFPTERIEVNNESRPRWISKQYTVSMHEMSALYKVVKAADPEDKFTNKGRNVKGLIGLPVQIEVGTTASGNAKVSSVSRVMKGIQVGELENKPIYFDFDDFDAEQFIKFPDFLQDLIKSAQDFNPDWLKGVAKKQEKRPVDMSDLEETPF